MAKIDNRQKIVTNAAKQTNNKFGTIGIPGLGYFAQFSYFDFSKFKSSKVEI